VHEKDTTVTQLSETDAPKILKSKICGLLNEVQEKGIADRKICALLNQVQALEERSAAAERAAAEAAAKKQAEEEAAAAEDTAKRAVAAAKKAAEKAAAAAAAKEAAAAAAAATEAEYHDVCPGSSEHEDSQPESRASDRRVAGEEGGLTEMVESPHRVPPSPRAEKFGGFKKLKSSGDSASGVSAVPLCLRAADTDALQLLCRLGALVLCIVALGTVLCVLPSQSLQTSAKTPPECAHHASSYAPPPHHASSHVSPPYQGHLGRPWRAKMASRASTVGAMTWTMSSMEHPLRDLRRSAPSSASLTSLGIVSPIIY
jgi:hypothetical protein